jgi:hypothetical protein
MRQEQGEMIDNLQKQLINLQHIVNQTNELDDVQTLDQTYEVNQLKELTLTPSASFFFSSNLHP